MRGAAVSLQGIAKDFGAAPVLKDLDLEIEAGEFLTLLGPSGCGKSTLLRLIAGFDTPSRGSMAIGGRRIDGLPPKERGLSMVFQNYALYPHMSVADNIAMPLLMRRLSFAQRFPGLGRLLPGSRARRREILGKVQETARVLEIDGLLARRPGQLSGGQRQRVALGRALVAQPSLFLMDEPLSNLDARLRIQMRSELTDLHAKLGITFIYVTHDQVEAMTMSQRVAVLMDGSLLQVGRPADIYAKPVDLRVARFVGAHPINVFEVGVGRDGAPELFGRPLPLRVAAAHGSPAYVAIRPENAEIDLDAPSPRCNGDTRAGGFATVTSSGATFGARLVKREDHGAEVMLHLLLDDSSETQLAVRCDAALRDRLPECGTSACRVRLPAAQMHVFDAEGRRLEPLESGLPAVAAGGQRR